MSVESFFEKLKQSEEARQKLTEVAEGAWDQVVDVAKSLGHDIDVDSLKKAVPEGFFKGRGALPDLGWNKDD